MHTDIFFKSYSEIIEQQRARNTYKVINVNTGDQVFNSTTHAAAYYFCRQYCGDNLHVPVKLLSFGADGEQINEENFIGELNSAGNYTMYQQNTLNRMASNKQKYQLIKQKSLEKRQRTSSIREQVNKIKADANAQIIQLKKQIEQIKINAQKQIAAIYASVNAPAETTDEITTDNEVIPDETIAAQEQQVDQQPIEEIQDEQPIRKQRRRK